MNVSTVDEAEWHAATDRYAQALLQMETGDLGARPAVLVAFRQLQALELQHASETATRTP